MQGHIVTATPVSDEAHKARVLEAMRMAAANYPKYGSIKIKL